MRKPCSTLYAPSLFVLLLSVFTAGSQAQLANRVPAIESAHMAPLPGSVHPMALAEADQGLVDNARVLQGMSLNFKRSAQQEANLKALLAAQQKPGSPSYHKWLTPAQFGKQFGMSAADIESVSDWLRDQGFTITAVAESRNSISFSGPVAAVEKAFQTQIHTYSVNQETHFANATDVSIPSALSGLVVSVRGLNDFHLKPKLRLARSRAVGANPHFTSGSSGEHFVSPADFATIYDVNPLYTAGFTGAGVTIAIVGQTAIVPADVTDFRAAAGLSVNNPTVVTVPGSTPLTATAGAATNDLDETDLDLEWSGGVATGASVVLVNSADVFTSLQYAIENTINGITIPIISQSYGDCEANYATMDLATIEGWLQEANGQGQTVMLASGDSGAADCDDSASTIITTATKGLAVDYPASSVYATAVGGSEFTGDGTAASPQTGAGTYWNATSGGTAADDLISSAKSYIPEMGWDDTAYSVEKGGGLSGGGGGVSALWKKPSWQAGVPNIPADGFRDVPDVALNASPDHDGYLYCTQVLTTGSGTTYVSSCQATSFRVSDAGQTDDAELTVAGGTSFAAPAFAGVMAIVEQKLASGGGLGNIGPSLYSLASNATTYASAFHDISAGNNQVPCTAGSTSCAATGTNNVIGYTAGVGYDQVTGLGSVDASNFATAYAALNQASGTTITLVATPGATLTTTENVTFTATVAPNTLTAAPTGTVTFYTDQVAGTPVAISSTAPYTATYQTDFPCPGPHLITATYTSGDTNYTNSYSSGVPVTVAPSGTAATTTTLTVTPATFGVGDSVTLMATVTATSPGTLTCAVAFANGGANIGTAQVTAGAGNTATATLTVNAAASLGFTTGANTITGSYSGDGINAASTGSTAVTISNKTITLSATNITISSPSPGNSGTSTVTLTSMGGYAGTATVSASASSLNADYGFGSAGAQTASVVLASAGTATTTVTITTIAATGNLQKGLGRSRLAAAGGTAVGCLLLLLVPGIRRKRWPAALVMLVFLSAGAGLGCGGGSSGSGGGGGAPAGTYTVTLTATDSSNANITGTTTFTVTIN